MNRPRTRPRLSGSPMKGPANKERLKPRTAQCITVQGWITERDTLT